MAAQTVIKKNRVESGDEVKSGVAKFDGPELSDTDVEVAEPRAIDEKAELMKFMEEPVTVVVHESPIDSLPVVDVGVDGQTEFFVRGVPKITKRKFVEQLVRARQTHYQMEEKEGGSVIDYRWRTSQRYPFSVEEDTPKGRAWLKRIISGARA